MTKNNIKIVKGVVCLVLAGVVSTAFAKFALEDWQYKRTINISDTGDFIKVILPNNISKTNDFKDVRVIDGNGEEAPYLLTRGITEGSVAARASVLNLGSSNGKTEFIADTLADGVVHTGISIETTSPNYKRQVSVYASNTLLPTESPKWSLVTDDGYIFKFSESVTGYSSGKDTIEFSPNTSRYFKVVIGSGAEGSVHVQDVTIFGKKQINIPTYTKSVPVKVANLDDIKVTHVTADLGESGLLTHAITLHSADKNFVRRVLVEASDAGENFRNVSSGSISNIRTPLFEGTSLRVDYPEQNARFIRISIVNNDNQPIQIGNTADVEGTDIGVIFKTTTSGGTYTLYYGNPNAASPVYDISQISAYIEENKIPVATLGAEILNQSYVPPKPPAVPFTEKNRVLLNIVLVLLVLVLGAGIAVYLKHYTSKKKETNSSSPKNTDDPWTVNK